jgi:hypothetical protein
MAQQQDGAHAELARENRRRPCVVRLHPATGDDRGGSAHLRLCQQILEFADLVAGLDAAGHVVALHPDGRTHEGVQRVVPPQRGRYVRELQPVGHASRVGAAGRAARRPSG